MAPFPVTSPPSPAFRRWFVIGFVVLLVLVAVQYTLKSSDERSAFVRWRPQLHGLGRGEDIYALHVYPNPPIMALILYPLALLPKVTLPQLDIDLGAITWFGLKVVMAMLSFVWAVRLVRQDGRELSQWGCLIVFLLSVRPIVGDLSHGNVNLFILFLIMAALTAFSRGRDVLAGVLIGLAISCKVTPALFIPYFAWKRCWKSLAGVGLGLGLFLFLVPSIFLGPGHNWTLLNSWCEKMVVPYATGGEVTTEHSNQSLPGLIYRLTTESPSFLDENDRPADFHNLVALESTVARRLLQVCSLSFLALLALTCRTPTCPRPSWRLAAEFSLVVLGMLLFSERTWKHHCVTLLLPFAALAYYIFTFRTSYTWRAYLIGTMAVAMLLMSLTSTSLWEKLANYRMGAKLAQVYGTYVWAYVALLAAIVALLFKHRKEPPIPWQADPLPASKPLLLGHDSFRPAIRSSPAL